MSIVNDVVVVGAGPVGCLTAIFWAKRGFKVDLYELRDDIRRVEIIRGRSINMALSTRGRLSLKYVGLEDEIVCKGIPMYGRMIHAVDGKCTAQQYSVTGEALLSVDRTILNKVLLNAAETSPNIRVHFRHKLKSSVLCRRELKFKSYESGDITVTAKTIIGCDGIHSKIRQRMMRESRLNYSQSYIGHVYVELTIPPTKDGKFAIEPTFLHIWPRETLMLVALPNLDKSFTCTLFIPLASINGLTNEEKILDFFREFFPDTIDLIGEKNLCLDILNNPTDELMYLKCDPHHFADHVVILGDAAHAMVPFYGQGMNCGLEDCLILDKILVDRNFDLATAFKEYSKCRIQDADAICDLSLYNYEEMRSHVNSRIFLIRRAIDNLIFRLLPNVYLPLYTMVTFSSLPYHEVVYRYKWQTRLLYGAILLILFLGIFMLWR